MPGSFAHFDVIRPHLKLLLLGLALLLLFLSSFSFTTFILLTISLALTSFLSWIPSRQPYDLLSPPASKLFYGAFALSAVLLLTHHVRINLFFILLLLAVSAFPPLRALSAHVKAARDRKLRDLGTPPELDPDAIPRLSVVAFDLENGLIDRSVQFSEVVTITDDTVCHFYFADGKFFVDDNAVNVSENPALSRLLSEKNTIKEEYELPQNYLDDGTGEVVELSQKVRETLDFQRRSWESEFRVCPVVAGSDGPLLGLVGFPHRFAEGAGSVIEELSQAGIRTIVWGRSDELLKRASEKLRIKAPIVKESEWAELSASSRSEKVRKGSEFSGFAEISGLVNAGRELGVVGIVSSNQEQCRAGDIGFKLGAGGFENLTKIIEGITIVRLAKEKFESIKVIVVSAALLELAISVVDALKRIGLVTPNVLLLVDALLMGLYWQRAVKAFQ